MRPQIVASVSEVVQAPERPYHRMKRAVASASVTILDKETGLPFNVYDAAVGGTLVSATGAGFATDDSSVVIFPGKAAIYADRPRQAVAVATKKGQTFQIEVPLLSGADLGGRELGYAEITANFDVTTIFPTYTAVTGLSDSVEIPDARPAYVEFSCTALRNLTSGSGVAIQLLRDTTQIGSVFMDRAPAANAGFGLGRRLRDQPAAGTYTYSVKMAALTSGTARIAAGPTDVASISIVGA